MKLVSATIAVLAFAQSCPAAAQKLEIGQQLQRPELPELSPCPAAGLIQTLSLPSGADGFWLPSEAARCMLGRLELLPEVLVYVTLLEQRQSYTDLRERLLRQETELAEREAERAESVLEAAERGRRRAEQERDAWHRSRVLWAVIGGIVVVALEAVAIYALKRLE